MMCIMDLTISINVHGTSVSLAVVVCVRLVRIAVVRAVVAAVSDIVPVIVVLSGIVDERAVVLFKDRGVARKRVKSFAK